MRHMLRYAAAACAAVIGFAIAGCAVDEPLCTAGESAQGCLARVCDEAGSDTTDGGCMVDGRWVDTAIVEEDLNGF